MTIHITKHAAKFSYDNDHPSNKTVTYFEDHRLELSEDVCQNLHSEVLIPVKCS